jgi:hypothetical protein
VIVIQVLLQQGFEGIQMVDPRGAEGFFPYQQIYSLTSFLIFFPPYLPFYVTLLCVCSCFKLAREQVEKSSFLGTQQETFGNPPVSYTVPPSVVEAPSGADTLSSPAQGIPSSPVSAGPDVAVSPVLVSGSPASTVIASTKDEKADGVQTLVNVVTSLASVPESGEASVSIASTIPASMYSQSC